MRKSVGKVIGLLVVTILSFSMLFIWSGNNVSAQEEWHVYPGQSIQDTADNASDGDTIYVHAGTYVENIKVNKRLDLIGDGIDEVTVIAKETDDHTFHLIADGITMTGFTITDSYLCGYGGIYIDGSDNCKISNTCCRDNLCAGIFIVHSNYCEITDCIVSDNDCGGIKIKENSDCNTIKNNFVERNKNVGLEISGESEDNLIYNNYFNNIGDYGKWKNVIDKIPWKNKWNITKESGTNIVGGPYLGGNYFADYTGNDNDGDGLGDTPYEIKNHPGNEVTNKDYSPLVEWAPQLSYNPTSYDFGDKQEGWVDSTTFEIWNSGTGVLTYSLSESCGWVTVSPTGGDSTGEHDTIIVDVDTTGLSPGDHTCDVDIGSNGGSGVFAVAVTVVEESEEPVLSYTPHSHNFGNKQEGWAGSATFEIWNSGTGTLGHTLSETCDWVNVNPTDGDSTGERDMITVDVDTTGLDPGDYAYPISITSNGGSGTFTVAVTVVEESEEPVLSHTPHSHNFGSMNKDWTDTIFFEIWNSGTGTLTYTLSETYNWITVDPTSGDSTGERDTVTMYVDTTGLDSGLYTCDISISSSGGNGTFTIILDIPSSKLDGISGVSDKTPGFEAVIAIAGLLLVTTIIFLRKKRGVK